MTRLPTSTLIAVITFVGGIGAGLVFPILPALGLQLGIPGFLVGLILSSNRIARLIFNLAAGKFYERLGPKRTLAGALSIEGLGMLMLSLALTSSVPGILLFAGRFIYGIGMAFLLVGAQAAVLSGSEQGNRGRRTAAVRIAINSAVPGGLLLGGVLADLYSDNVAFLTGAAFSLAGALLAAFLIPSGSAARAGLEPSPHDAQTNTASASDEDFGFRALLRTRNRSALISAWIFNFFVFLTVQGALLATLVLLVQWRGLSFLGMDAKGSSSLVMAVMIGTAAVSAFAVGRLIDRLTLRSTTLFPSLIGLTAGFSLLAAAQDLPVLFLGAIVTGLSYNSITVPMLALLGDATSERQLGPAAAVFQWCGDVGGTIGPMLGIEVATHLGLAPLYFGLAGISALVIFIALWLRRQERALPVAG